MGTVREVAVEVMVVETAAVVVVGVIVTVSESSVSLYVLYADVDGWYCVNVAVMMDDVVEVMLEMKR